MSSSKVSQKTKFLIFGTKYAICGYFGDRILKKLLSDLKSTPSNLSNCNILQRKMPRFGTKNGLFGYFSTKILKHYSHIWNHHPQICQIGNIRGKTKIA